MTDAKPRRSARALPPPPDHLDAPERLLWSELVGTFDLSDPGSLSVLAASIESRGRMRRCRECIDKDGESCRDRFGQLRAHPLLAAERDARAAFLAGMRLLRLDMGAAQ